MKMLTVNVYNLEKEQTGSVDLNPAIFGVEVKEHLFYTVVRQQMANRRSGNHKVKNRAEVSGGGRKPFRQKGTGRARAGTIRAAQWRGGGVVFGPHPRSHGFKVPKKVRKAALKSALSRRAEEAAITVFDAFNLPEIKTKAFKTVMNSFELDQVLLVLSEKDETVMKSARNLPGVTVMPVAGLNVYDILRHRNLAVTRAALDGIAARLGN
jgi:large subunit ribosomal protein L4